MDYGPCSKRDELKIVAKVAYDPPTKGCSAMWPPYYLSLGPQLEASSSAQKQLKNGRKELFVVVYLKM